LNCFHLRGRIASRFLVLLAPRTDERYYCVLICGEEGPLGFKGMGMWRYGGDFGTRRRTGTRARSGALTRFSTPRLLDELSPWSKLLSNIIALKGTSDLSDSFILNSKHE
jgi:hypothetical protein